jgi:hypothetical protein
MRDIRPCPTDARCRPARVPHDVNAAEIVDELIEAALVSRRGFVQLRAATAA